MSDAPTPAALVGLKRHASIASTTQIAAQVTETAPGKIVRPVQTAEAVNEIHDGVIKARQLKPGQTVRPYLHGSPRGSERVVETVTRVEDGAMVEITYSSPHPAAKVKAAYRFYDASLVGTVKTQVRRVAKFVEVER